MIDPENNQDTSLIHRTTKSKPPPNLGRFLIGRPLQTADAPHQTIGKAVGLAVFASDALSSTAYATQEILIAFRKVLAGSLHVKINPQPWLIPHGYRAFLDNRIGQPLDDLVPPLGSPHRIFKGNIILGQGCAHLYQLFPSLGVGPGPMTPCFFPSPAATPTTFGRSVFPREPAKSPTLPRD